MMNEYYDEKFEVMLKNIEDGIIILDCNCKITNYNEKIKSILNIKFDKILGKYISDFIPQFKAKKVIDSGIGQKYELVEINGVKIISSTIPIKRENKVVGAIIFIFENMNTYKLLQELNKNKKYIKELESILERTYDGVVAVNKEGIITLMSKSYAEYLGVDQKETVGRHVTEVIDNTRMHIVIKKGRVENTELQKINDKYIIATRIPIIENGEIVGAVANVLFRNTRNYNLFYKKINKIEKEFENKKDKQISKAIYSFENIVGDSEIIEETKSLARKAACTNSSVLLKGESGTGKELFAHAIHNTSKRSKQNFIKVNCAAIPNELLESELFGYEKGSFTGANIEGRMGKFELADGGTIFLDEIGDMPLKMQAKLLRVLQEREVERIGANSAKKIDIRIISATNRNLESMVNKGEFREDLYYRLNVVEINIPPLKERKDDIILLVSYLINKLCERLDKKINGISNEAIKLLKNYQWEGNVRQLENVIERAINVVEDGEKISPEHLPVKITGIVFNQKVESLDEVLNKTEKHAIINALTMCYGNKTKAAKMLNISRSTLYEKMNKHNMLV
ncbi:sigma 54-interacting transcriptional regulator [Clostridium aestuarii]|uniref:Sigma 54-interacting transcriptional regulator n=1 Tax=Clostridium aestuarii TaxID=338193 RepID=A0ABT4D243_9CLOT|nr:sigma 54-interacting transcriptional regulator [Clostridium aestuarii]MCY6484355.1 sigma 54-interacting transcriptional regulator [Clostridium aestuarii]